MALRKKNKNRNKIKKITEITKLKIKEKKIKLSVQRQILITGYKQFKMIENLNNMTLVNLII